MCDGQICFVNQKHFFVVLSYNQLKYTYPTDLTTKLSQRQIIILSSKQSNGYYQVTQDRTHEINNIYENCKQQCEIINWLTSTAPHRLLAPKLIKVAMSHSTWKMDRL